MGSRVVFWGYPWARKWENTAPRIRSITYRGWKIKGLCYYYTKLFLLNIRHPARELSSKLCGKLAGSGAGAEISGHLYCIGVMDFQNTVYERFGVRRCPFLRIHTKTPGKRTKQFTFMTLKPLIAALDYSILTLSTC